ncbi:hypothetical protein MACK_003252 [Theileria orientalis]|uniref:Uncharacterized protein n=1 Tax=Theileria orientalis TaxID=68886 RepID=A0A976SIE7_THEOR|nr:hypothetical protein MACK_003252 [Theileria orientalis]
MKNRIDNILMYTFKTEKRKYKLFNYVFKFYFNSDQNVRVVPKQSLLNVVISKKSQNMLQKQLIGIKKKKSYKNI